MGVANSKNYVDTATEVVNKVATEIIANTDLSTNNSVLIYVSKVDGDFIFSNNVVKQQATLNMSQLMDTLSSDTIQTKLRDELEQSVKSLLSDLNIFQWADAQNSAKQVVNATLDMSKTFKNSCASSASNEVKVVVEHVKGDVVMTGNLIQQVSNVLSACVSKTLSANSVISDFDKKLKQAASAEASGINLNFLALIFVAMAGAAGFGSISLGRILFPLMILVGIGLVVWAYRSQKSNVECTAYSKLIKAQCTATEKYTVPAGGQTVKNAEQTLMADPSLVAFDFVEVTVDNKTGVQTSITPSITYFSKISSNCQESIRLDKDKTKISNQIGVNWSGFKSSTLKTWLVWLGLGLVVLGLLGSVFQFSRNKPPSYSSSSSAVPTLQQAQPYEEIEMTQF